MKPAEIRPGRTYEGRDGSRRLAHYIGTAQKLGSMSAVTERWVSYRSGGKMSRCALATFARWAMQDVTDAGE